MIKVGITGGIGSGKTSFCDIWKSFGAHVVNADDLAKSLMTHNQDIKAQIIQIFGTSSYSKDGSLDRRFLAKEAFTKGRIAELNAIVHPHIPDAVEQEMQAAEEEGTAVFLYEAALLLQNLRPKHLDYVILLLADEKQRINRVRERDGVMEHDVAERINKQQDFSKLTDPADIVVENNGTLQELKVKAAKLYETLTEAGLNKAGRQ